MAITFGIVVAVIVIYVLSLIAVHLLAKSAPALPPVDFSKLEADDSVVQVHLEKLDTVANRLTVNVLVYPKDSLYDKNFGVLTTDAAVRLYPENDLGDLQYPVGKAPAQVSTALVAHGDPGNWPFDSYKTEVLAADVFTGTGQNREKAPARVEVTGKLDGWDATVTRVHDPEDPNPDVQDNVIITLERSKGPLIFDVGICLVLIALPVLALWVAIPMVLGRTTFLPPLGTWFAALLFAVVPLRNFLPGSPPPGSWIDQAVVLWVLIGLVTAMSLFIVAWWRSREKKTPKRA
nr:MULTISPECIES: DUF4436 domain-containing protein [unclassified Mycobacterium]